MLKKFLIVILAVITAVSLAACGEPKKEAEPETTTPAETTTPEETTTPAETATPAETTTPEETEPAAPAVPEVPEGIMVPDQMLPEARAGVVAADGDVLTLRQGPDSTYEGIDAIPDETPLLIEAEQDGWGFVNYNDQYGWVSLDFVQ